MLGGLVKGEDGTGELVTEDVCGTLMELLMVAVVFLLF